MKKGLRCLEIKMARKELEGTIEKLYVNHYPNKGFFGCAKMSLWADVIGKEAEEHLVWLDTITGLDTNRIEQKKKDYFNEHKNKIGMKIKYVLKNRYADYGFVRSYLNSAGGLSGENGDE